MDSFAARSQHKYFLSLVAPPKDEESYLIEFVNYYVIHGVDHFYFYDNERAGSRSSRCSPTIASIAP